MKNSKIENIEKKRRALQAKREKIQEKIALLETQVNSMYDKDAEYLREINEITKSLWNISDAKPGDILTTTGCRKLVFIYKGMGTRSFCNGNVLEYFCDYDIEYGKLSFPDKDNFMGHEGDYGIRPALDSEIELLKLAMKKEEVVYDKDLNKLVYTSPITERYNNKLIPSFLEELRKSGLPESASTAADVIDWLADKGIFIEMKPYYTCALASKMGFAYIINIVNNVNANIDRYEDDDFASFNLCAGAAIKKAIEFLK